MTVSAEGNAGTGAGAVEMAADLVSAYVSHNPLPISELPGLIENIHGALVQLAQPAAVPSEPLVPPVPIRKSVTPDHIISLEDGKPYKTLKRHLARLGLTPDQYRQKWGLPSTYPMTAATYAAQRSELAKSIGLGQQRSKGRPGKAS
ncbi:MucR family transcriptional regulator [Methylobacterium oryzisoli]|uniref:MucR family transcriptional regulator n=1 Tax=Methylobacterium oryzisoli TaxID=3385502 RepID=UPI003891B6D7